MSKHTKSPTNLQSKNMMNSLMIAVETLNPLFLARRRALRLRSASDDGGSGGDGGSSQESAEDKDPSCSLHFNRRPFQRPPPRFPRFPPLLRPGLLRHELVAGLLRRRPRRHQRGQLRCDLLHLGRSPRSRHSKSTAPATRKIKRTREFGEQVRTKMQGSIEVKVASAPSRAANGGVPKASTRSSWRAVGSCSTRRLLGDAIGGETCWITAQLAAAENSILHGRIGCGGKWRMA